MANKIQRYVRALKALGACKKSLNWISDLVEADHQLTVNDLWLRAPYHWNLFMLQASAGFKSDAHLMVQWRAAALRDHAGEIVAKIDPRASDTEIDNATESVIKDMVIWYYPTPPALSLLEKEAAKAREKRRKQQAAIKQLAASKARSKKRGKKS